MGIEALSLYAASRPAPAQELGDLIDGWQSAVPELLDHEQTTALVAELQRVGQKPTPSNWLRRLCPWACAS